MDNEQPTTALSCPICSGPLEFDRPICSGCSAVVEGQDRPSAPHYSRTILWTAIGVLAGLVVLGKLAWQFVHEAFSPF